MNTGSGWSEAVRMFERVGISTPPWRIVRSVQEVAPALAALTPPVAVKAMPAGAVDHKTELGLVELGLSDGGVIAGAVGRMLRDTGGEPVLIQELVHSHVEVVLAVRRDRDFGPILTIGHGGRFVEVLDDLVHLAAPVEPDEVRAALCGLRMWRLLHDFRGYPDRDTPALIRAACALADAYVAGGYEEIEINPLLLGAVGEGVFAVDVVLS